MEPDALLVLFQSFQDDYRAGKTEILNAIKGVHARLDELNGRTRKNTEEIAIINARKDERDRRVNELKESVESLRKVVSTEHPEAKKVLDGGDDDSMVSLRMSKAMFLSVVSGISALWVILAPYISKLLGNQ